MPQMDNVTEPFLLWVPVHEEIPEEEIDNLIQKATLANNAVLDFAEGIITLDNTFQIIEHYGTDIDEYQTIIDENMRTLGA